VRPFQGSGSAHAPCGVEPLFVCAVSQVLRVMEAVRVLVPVALFALFVVTWFVIRR
jgi:hypothetical protein